VGFLSVSLNSEWNPVVLRANINFAFAFPLSFYLYLSVQLTC